MKRLIVALCLFAAPAALRAQTCAASPCSATPVVTNLKVKSAVTFTANGLVDFGSIAPGGTASITADGVGTGTAAGVIMNANQAVTVTATFAALTSAGMPNLSVTNPTCGYSILATTNTTNTTLFDCTTGHLSPATGTGATGLYIWLGGEIATTAATPAGNYAGSATIRGVYTAY
jgi:hypothetical protein